MHKCLQIFNNAFSSSACFYAFVRVLAPNFRLIPDFPRQPFLTISYNGYVYETFGISKRFLVNLQLLIIQAETLDNLLTAKCFIYDVVRWPLLFLNLSVSILAYCLLVRALERDGLEGSFGIFGLRASIVGMPNVPEAKGRCGVA